MARIFYTRAQRLAAAKLRAKRRTFDNTTREISIDIQRMVFGGLERKTGYTKVARRIEEKHDLPPQQAETIVQTESHEIEGVMREINFQESDPYGREKYRWVVNRDKRRCAICERIGDRTKNGVTLERLKEIIREEKVRAGIKNLDYEWTVHPRDRCTAARVFS
jgi:hypothetical protein